MELVLAYERLEDVLALVREYVRTLLEQGGEDIQKCLRAQHLGDELADMQKKYAPPGGRLYLVLVDGNAAGCAGLARNDDDYCEIKRLYVRPEYRGQHISRLLVDRLLDDAKTIGYRHMRLDTFPFMETAVRLYEKYGFYRVPRYNDNPVETAVFMQLDL